MSACSNISVHCITLHTRDNYLDILRRGRHVRAQPCTSRQHCSWSLTCVRHTNIGTVALPYSAKLRPDSQPGCGRTRRVYVGLAHHVPSWPETGIVAPRRPLGPTCTAPRSSRQSRYMHSQLDVLILACRDSAWLNPRVLARFADEVMR